MERKDAVTPSMFRSQSSETPDEEAMARVDALFDRIDRNNDGGKYSFVVPHESH